MLLIGLGDWERLPFFCMLLWLLINIHLFFFIVYSLCQVFTSAFVPFFSQNLTHSRSHVLSYWIRYCPCVKAKPNFTSCKKYDVFVWQAKGTTLWSRIEHLYNETSFGILSWGSLQGCKKLLKKYKSTTFGMNMHTTYVFLKLP